jgi:hypothetical protein
MLIKIPNGLDEIIHTFGSISDPHFEARNIVQFDLPYPLMYEGKQRVTRASAHRLAVPHFQAAFNNIERAGLRDQFTEFEGIFAKRAIRGQPAHPSLHWFGVAIDMLASRYPLGSMGRMPVMVVECFHKAGFFYGGDFKSRKDPMHFQLATGY